MIPKTAIRYSSIYNRMFNKTFSNKDFNKLKKDCNSFETFYKKYISEILKLIEKHHLKKWKYNFIPIYIVRDIPSSFSDPLTLRFNKKSKFMLVTLSHELLHNNMGKKKFKNSGELHKYMEPILNKIARDLSIDLTDELLIFNKIINKKYKK